MTTTAPEIEISIVAAAYNEEDNVGPLYAAVKQWLKDETFELLIVDDGSRDDTVGRVRQLSAADPRVRLVRLARNYGVQAAYLAGMSAARGRAIVTLDCDLQHPPSMRLWRRGARIVVMRRNEYESSRSLRLWSSRFYTALVRFISDEPFVGEIGDFLLLDRRARNRLLRRLPPRPYWRSLIPWLGFPLHFLPYQVAPRNAGASRFSFSRLLLLARDGILTSSTRPLRLSLHLGVVTMVVLALYVVGVVIAWYRGHSVPGYPTVIITMALLGSVQLIALGIIGEYLGRVYDQARRVPPFVIQEAEDALPDEGAAGHSDVQ
jgi:glycosyltransferase involved in cell wall biosynthesis